MDKTLLAVIIFVLICWVAAVAIWRGANRRVNAWREIIKKGDYAFFINQLGERAVVKVIAVDNSRTNNIHIELEWNEKISDMWVESAELYPAPTPGRY